MSIRGIFVFYENCIYLPMKKFNNEDCYRPDDCQLNHMGCGCKPNKKKRKLRVLLRYSKRGLILAFMVTMVFTLWFFIFYIIQNAK